MTLRVLSLRFSTRRLRRQTSALFRLCPCSIRLQSDALGKQRIFNITVSVTSSVLGRIDHYETKTPRLALGAVAEKLPTPKLSSANSKVLSQNRLHANNPLA